MVWYDLPKDQPDFGVSLQVLLSISLVNLSCFTQFDHGEGWESFKDLGCPSFGVPIHSSPPFEFLITRAPRVLRYGDPVTTCNCPCEYKAAFTPRVDKQLVLLNEHLPKDV